MTKKRTKVRRLGEILAILMKYGFAEILNRLRIGVRLPFRFRRLPEKVVRENIEKPFAIRIRLALEELGPTFIKFGQALSMRPDLLPENIVVELEKLQDQVPAFSVAEVKEIIGNQFGRPFEQIFREFDDIPEAAASIAQVHRAILFSGEEVAVKIQRPGIHELIKIDVEILANLAQLAERHLPEMALLNPTGVVKEFAVNLNRELDFNKEGRNIESFKKYFAADPDVRIPTVYWDFCTEKVITMEFIRGIKISELEKLKKTDCDFALIARRGVDIFFKQIFDFGFFHGDPHPGNIFILPGNIIAPIDFGIVGFVSDFHQQELGRALSAFVHRDPRLLIKVLRDMDLLEDTAVSRELSFDLEHLINYYYNISLKEINLGAVILELIDIIRKYHIKIPTDLILLGKAVATMETLGKNLDPKFDISEAAKPYVKKMMLGNINPLKRIKDIQRIIEDTGDLLNELPDEIRLILKKVRNDKLKIKFEHGGLDHFIKEMDKASNRLSFSVIIAAILVGSSMITQVNQGPTILGIPVVGFIGYTVAGILGIWLVIGIIRSGRL